MNIQSIGNTFPSNASASQPAQDSGAAVRKSQVSQQAAASVVQNPAQTVEKAQSVDNEAVRKAVEQVQEFVSDIAQNLEFSVDNDTGRTVVKVIDRQTDEILRQIPSEEMLQIAKALGKLNGLLVQQKA